MAETKMTEARVVTVKVDTARAQRVCDGVIKLLEEQHATADLKAVEAEVALGMAYCLVAGGVSLYPESNRQARIRVLLERLMRRMAETVIEVGALTDDDVRAYVADGRMTCQQS